MLFLSLTNSKISHESWQCSNNNHFCGHEAAESKIWDRRRCQLVWCAQWRTGSVDTDAVVVKKTILLILAHCHQLMDGVAGASSGGSLFGASSGGWCLKPLEFKASEDQTCSCCGQEQPPAVEASSVEAEASELEKPAVQVVWPLKGLWTKIQVGAGASSGSSLFGAAAG